VQLWAENGYVPVAIEILKAIIGKDEHLWVRHPVSGIPAPNKFVINPSMARQSV
jgi:hypothetical protein